MKKHAVEQSKKTYTTLKIFLICFLVYFVCNTYQK